MLRTLREADVVACEDTRHTRKLLDRHEIEARLVSFHEHNERRRAGELVAAGGGGRAGRARQRRGHAGRVGPGVRAGARACLARELPVEVLPGPSAVVTALVASGLPAERWRFAGFLPRKEGELRAELERAGETLVAFESPGRLGAHVAALAEVDPERPVAVCRELTKLHEEVVRGSARGGRALRRGARGEIVLVVGPAAESGRDLDVDAARAAVERLVEAGARRRAAASVVASLTGVSANTLYGR